MPSVQHGTVLPFDGQPGDIFVKTDAATGAQLYVREKASWVPQTSGSGTSLIGKGTTPASGWTAGTGHSYKDVTVAGAAVEDIVIATLNAVAFSGVPAELRYVQGYVTGANTVRIYYASLNHDGGGSAGSTTVPGVVSYAVIRPS